MLDLAWGYNGRGPRRNDDFWSGSHQFAWSRAFQLYIGTVTSKVEIKHFGKGFTMARSSLMLDTDQLSHIGPVMDSVDDAFKIALHSSIQFLE